METKKERDYACDLIRILATYIVVATHVKLGFWEDDHIISTRLFFACLFGDGVSIFLFFQVFLCLMALLLGIGLKNAFYLLCCQRF